MGLVLLGWLKYQEKNNNFPAGRKNSAGLSHISEVGDIVVIAAVTGILGAKIFSISKNLAAGSNSGRIRWVIF